jgi:hypothetical protein
MSSHRGFWERRLNFLKKEFELLERRERLFEEKLQSKHVIADAQDYGGRFTFCFKGLKDFTIQITTKSKLGITYPKTSNYDVVLETLKPIIRTAG